MRLIALAFGVFAASLMMNCRHAAAESTSGKWTKLTHPYPVPGLSGTMLLLTDGTILVNAYDSTAWHKLTPDSTGGYIDGTWSPAACMISRRTYFNSQVMPDGRVCVLGGKYSCVPTGEIYDPLFDTWTPIWCSFALSLPRFDSPSTLLPSGEILFGDVSQAGTYLFNPTTETFSQTGTKLRNDSSYSETWISLPGGNVLSYDLSASPAAGPGSSQRYDSSTGSWSDAGTVPVPLSGLDVNFGMGPATLLPTGDVLQIGGNENTVLYSPSSNTWVRGPTLSAGNSADFAPGVMVPDGHFIFLTFQNFSSIRMMDYDVAGNSISDITATLPAALHADLAKSNVFDRLFLVLPNGHVLFNAGNQAIWDYAPSGSPQTAWKPTIASITHGTDADPASYTLNGGHLTGLWQGASKGGSSVETDTNYPIVTVTGPNSGSTVYFARTTNWTPGVSNVGNTALSSVQFMLPPGMAGGTYQVVVSANGIGSSSYSYLFPATSINYVRVAYDKRDNELTLWDDPGDNSVRVTLNNGRLTVLGVGNTLLGNSSSSKQEMVWQIGHNRVDVEAEFTHGGNNTFTMIGVASSDTLITFGPGNDAANLTYCNIGTLTANGGGGFNFLKLTGSVVKTKHVKRFLRTH